MVQPKHCGCNSSQDLVALQRDGSQHLGRMRSAVELLLRGLGEDPTREGLVDTPRRVAKAWLDIASGYSQECTRAFGKALFHEPIVSRGSGGLVVVRDITFAAISEHTLLPFHGRAHIAYIPRDGVILGLSKLARVTKCLASKLQQQQAFTRNLMDAVQSAVGPHGVAVVVQANHLGLGSACRPVAQQVTNAVSGCFEKAGSGLLVEFLTLLRLSGVAAAATLLPEQQQGQRQEGAAPPQLQQFGLDVTPSVEQLCRQSEREPAVHSEISQLDMAAAVKALLEGVGEVPSRPGLKGSAERYVQWLVAATAGYRMSLPCCQKGSPAAASVSAAEEAAGSGGGEGPVAGALAGLCFRDSGSSPEAPATPEDHSPEASCASSDMSADEPLPCYQMPGSPEANAVEELPGTSEAAAGTAGAPVVALDGHSNGSGSSCCCDAGDLQHRRQRGHQQQNQRQQQQQQIRTFSTQFASQCEHHLLPFYGTLRVAYVPGAAPVQEAAARQQLQSIVEMYSKRLQVQERLSHQVADAALSTLGASSVLVVVDSAHMCMVARGVEKHASTTLTTASRGEWAGDAAARTAAMEALLPPLQSV